MAEYFPRTRDCIMMFKGDTYTVAVGPNLLASGWGGGQGVVWVPPIRREDPWMVEASDGLYGGFLLWGSDEDSDRLTAMTWNQLRYKFATLCAGGWLISTIAFERYTYASRTGGGPDVPVAYAPNDRLTFSLRGLWTNEDEWTLSGDPRAPNTYYIGYVTQIPTAANSYYMTVQTSI